MKSRAKWWIPFLAVVLIALGASVWALQNRVEAGVDGSANLRTVLEVISLIKTQHVKEIDSLALIAGFIEKGTINGMLSEALDDPYTRFMDDRAYEQTQIDIFGEYGGVGIMVGLKEERLTVIAPFEGTPGFHAGLRPGDFIVTINGKSTEYMSLDEAVSLMRGPKGARLVLGIERNDGEPFEVDIVRDIIRVPSVSDVRVLTARDVPELTEPIGYIRLQRFSERSESELDAALDELVQQGAGGIVLDLRDNPGGPLTAAIEVANKFLSDGPIMHIVGRDGERRTVYALAQGAYPDLPVVVLVNSFSASASEIVAGALKDRGRAQIVGTTTFGKGSVQTIVPLRDGSALSLTSAHYQTAGGNDINGVGVSPDVEVAIPEDQDPFEVTSLYGGELTEDPQFLAAAQRLMQTIAAGAAAGRRAG